MNASRNPPSWFSSERRLSGGGRVFLGFVAGALFALLPVYYFYMGRDVALRGTPGSQAGPATGAESPRNRESNASGDSFNRFASRMTYELSRLPKEPPYAPAKAQPAAPSTASKQAEPKQTAPQRPITRPPDEPASRVANARPITATPPEPRDTTRAIEKEARRPERREPPPIRQESKAPSVPLQPRYIEGRDLVIGPKSAAPAKETRTVVAAGPVIAGAAPIGPPPEATPRGSAASSTAAAAATRTPLSDAADIESRLAATREWLISAPQTTHTIQILGAGNEEQLKAHLKGLARLLEPSRIYVFRTIAQGKPSMTVVYGAYVDRKAALQALEKLPEAVTMNRPVLRTVKSIRAEMTQNKRDF